MSATAIVTGSTSDIGKATASLSAKIECNVAVCSRNQNDVNNTVKEINNLCSASNEKEKEKAIGFKCDVSIPSDVNSLVKATMDKFGQIDILINNAGFLVYKNLIDTSDQEWEKVIQINLKGTFLFCKAVLPHMIKKNSGVIINVSSRCGKTDIPNLSAYCASKFGIMGLSESLAREISDYNIKIMIMCPAEINTPMIKKANYSGYTPRSKIEEMYKPEDVAQKILDIISKSEEYKNGQCVEFYSGISQ